MPDLSFSKKLKALFEEEIHHLKSAPIAFLISVSLLGWGAWEMSGWYNAHKIDDLNSTVARLNEELKLCAIKLPSGAPNSPLRWDQGQNGQLLQPVQPPCQPAISNVGQIKNLTLDRNIVRGCGPLLNNTGKIGTSSIEDNQVK